MKPDKDRPSSWVRYRDGMCNGCYAGCCTMPVEVKTADLVLLGVATEDEVSGSLKKLSKKLIREKVVSSYRESTDLFILQARPNGDCTFLDKHSRMCTVYERRPGVCRAFPAIGPRPGYCPGCKK